MGENIKDENFVVIQGFMVSELHLKSNELIIYAIIFGFSQSEGQKFSGSLQYLADWTSSTRQGVLKNLKSLVEKGLIERMENVINGVKFVDYRVTKFNGVLNKVERGVKQSLTGGVKQSLNHNIDIHNIEHNIEDNIKRAYGTFQKVKLTDAEYERLGNDYGEDVREKAIDFLDKYIKEKHYKSYEHNLAIRRWVIKAVTEEKGNLKDKVEAMRNW